MSVFSRGIGTYLAAGDGMRTLRIVLGSVALVAVSACSGDDSSPASSSGSDGGDAGGRLVDSGSTGADGGGRTTPPADAATDAGAGGDGAIADASANDGEAGTGCQAGGYLMCEDFESTAAGSIPAAWTKSGEVAVATDQVHTGAHALKVGVATNGPRRINRPLTSLGNAAADHWGRVFYKVASPAPTYNGYLHSTIVAMQGKSPVDGIPIEARVVDTVQGPQATNQFLYNVQPNGRNEFGTGSDYDYKYDANWHCAEWHVVYATQSYDFYLDGAELPKLHIAAGAGNYTNVEIPSAYDSISIGWNNYQVLPSGGFEAWLDDFALSTAKIGCN